MAADELPEVVPAPTEEETVAVGVSAMGAQEEVPPPSEEEPLGRAPSDEEPPRRKKRRRKKKNTSFYDPRTNAWQKEPPSY